MQLFDHSSDIIQWSSEEVVVGYRSPVDNRQHRYFLDFWIKRKDGREFILEVKPSKETVPPVQPKRMTAAYKKKVATYAINESKWAAARTYASKRGMEFQIITEKELF